MYVPQFPEVFHFGSSAKHASRHAKTLHPKGSSIVASGCCWKKASSGGSSPFPVPMVLTTCPAFARQNHHNSTGPLQHLSAALASLVSVPISRSARGFCCGVYGDE